MYAVVAPGFYNIYTDFKKVERARVLYPYLKWKKVFSEREGMEFINRNKCSKRISLVYNYGDTFRDKYITAHYKIKEDSVVFLLDTRRIGRISIPVDGCLIQYKRYQIEITVPNMYLSEERISGHMSAIYTLLETIGEFVDVNIVVPNYSIFYALAYYSGNSREVSLVRNLINQRTCKVGFTLERKG